MVNSGVAAVSAASSAHSPFSENDGLLPHSQGSILPGWNPAETVFRTGSIVRCFGNSAEELPILDSAAGLRLENTYRPEIGKYFERRYKFPSRCPTGGSFHQHCCSTHVPTAGRREIAGRSNVVSCFSIGVPFVDFRQKGTVCFRRRPSLGVLMQFAVPAAFSVPVRDATSHGLWPGADALFPSRPVPPVSVPAKAHQIDR